MPLGSFSVESFGGLNLVDDPAEVGVKGAIDLRNVDFDRHGRVRQRDGYEIFLANDGLTSGAHGRQIVPFYDGTNSQFVMLTTAETQIVGSGGALVAVRSTAPRFAATFGTPTAPRAYIAEAANRVRWSGSAFTALGYPTSAAGLAVTPWDNRLVLANVTEAGPTNYPSRVRFSDAGDAETFSANNYVDLHPGDGEEIVGMANWQNQLFVFKRTKFFVFYGTSVDSAGQPIFDHRAVDAGIGLGAASILPVQSMPDALYAVTPSGLVKTNGSTVTPVPGPLDVLLRGSTHPFFTTTITTSVTVTNCRLMRSYERLVVSVQGTATTDWVNFLYHPDRGTWTYWTPSVTGFAWDPRSALPSDVTYGVLSAPATPPAIVRFKPSLTTDDNTAISSYYRSGLYGPAAPDDVIVRHTTVRGAGTVGFAMSPANDSDVGVSTATSLTLGTAPTSAKAHYPRAHHGAPFLSYKLSSVSGGAWQVDRIDHRWMVGRRGR